jgi:photosystem II stability/assembly factor-like uncharacterized protein
MQHGYIHTDTTLADVAFFNATHGWIVGEKGAGIYEGIVLHTRNGGTTWDLQLYNESQYFLQIELIDDKTIWITARGSLFYSLDSGETWHQSVVVDGLSGMSMVTFNNKTHGWTATIGTLYNTVNGGLSWQIVPGWNFTDDVPRRMQFVSSQRVWAIGFFGIYLSDDGGMTWQQRYNKGGWALSFSNEINGWAVGDNMLARISVGETWSEVPLPMSPNFLPPYFSDILFIDDNNGWIVGRENPVIYTPNGGWDWYEQSSPAGPTERLMAVDFINVTHGWAVGHDGIAIRTVLGNSLGQLIWSGTNNLSLTFTLAIAVIAVGVICGVVLRRRKVESKSNILE